MISALVADLTFSKVEGPLSLPIPTTVKAEGKAVIDYDNVVYMVAAGILAAWLTLTLVGTMLIVLVSLIGALCCYFMCCYRKRLLL